MITNVQTGTNVHEIADGIYRINTPVDLPDGQAFNFNQYLVLDDEPLLFHTGPRQLFPLVREAVVSLMPIERLRFVALSHIEADECGSMNEWLAAAPAAVPVCSQIGAMVSINDLADRPPRALADGEQLALGRHTLQWFDTPHVPHGWDCGLLMDALTGTFFCGDLFTQPGRGEQALTRRRHPRSERSLPPTDGLLRPRAAHRGDARASGRAESAHPGLHARQRLAGRRGRLAAPTLRSGLRPALSNATSRGACSLPCARATPAHPAQRTGLCNASRVDARLLGTGDDRGQGEL